MDSKGLLQSHWLARVLCKEGSSVGEVLDIMHGSIGHPTHQGLHFGNPAATCNVLFRRYCFGL